MPLEDLEDLGYTVSRPPGGITPPTGPSVYGFGQQWYLQPGQDEGDVVAEARNHKALYDKMLQAQDYFAGNYQNWASMTAQQKDAANRQTQRALTNLIRYVRGDLTSGGD